MSDSEGYHYYYGRIIKMRNFQKLKEETLLCFNKNTILVFLVWLYQDLQEYLEINDARIPGILIG